MIDPLLDVSQYDSFLDYLKTIRTPSRPYDRFVALVLHLPRKVAIGHLTLATHDSDTQVICESLDLLARLSPESARSRCIALLTHEDFHVRLLAVTTLRRAETPCEDDILRLLAVETNGDVRYACVRFLAELGTRNSIAALQNIVAHDNSIDYEGRPIRLIAADALKRISSSPRQQRD
jgi:HEAT repeats